MICGGHEFPSHLNERAFFPPTPSQFCAAPLKLRVVVILNHKGSRRAYARISHNSRTLPSAISLHTLGIGHPEVDKKTGQQVRDEKGRLKITLTGAGRTNVEKLVDYMREKAQISIPVSHEQMRSKLHNSPGSA
jgi:hypothetical protein